MEGCFTSDQSSSAVMDHLWWSCEQERFHFYDSSTRSTWKSIYINTHRGYKTDRKRNGVFKKNQLFGTERSEKLLTGMR